LCFRNYFTWLPYCLDENICFKIFKKIVKLVTIVAFCSWWQVGSSESSFWRHWWEEVAVTFFIKINRWRLQWTFCDSADAALNVTDAFQVDWTGNKMFFVISEHFDFELLSHSKLKYKTILAYIYSDFLVR
jgi:hypothetical protein